MAQTGACMVQQLMRCHGRRPPDQWQMYELLRPFMGLAAVNVMVFSIERIYADDNLNKCATRTEHMLILDKDFQEDKTFLFVESV